MGAVRWSARALLAGLAVALTALALGAGPAQAATCTDSWTGAVNRNWFTAGNWDHGVPTDTSDVCINNPSDVTVIISGNTPAQANSLQLGVGAGAGTQTLEIQGLDTGSSELAELDLQNGGTIGSTGHLILTGDCSSGSCTQGAPASLTNLGSTPLTNQGTIESVQGNEAADLAIFSDAINQGTILVNADLTWSGGTVDNQGTISLMGGHSLTFGCCSNTAGLTNDTNGQITNNNGSGSVIVGPKATFTQGAGTTDPSTVSPAHPAVIVDGAGPAANLVYTGTGASTIEARETDNLSAGSGLAAGQNLIINGVTNCPFQTLVTAASGFTNAGTITLAGTCDSGLKITSGALSNTGTLTMAATGSNVTRELKSGLVNSGTFQVSGDTAFDRSGATLQQTAGSTTIGAGVILDASGSGSTFQLQGGTISGGGQTQSTAAIINGPVDNSGGNIIPGSATTPGLMTVGAYTQDSGGRLTIGVSGAGGPSGVGTHYSQLASTGNMTLGGTLTISTLANPSVGDFDTIVGTNGALSGKFSTVTGAFSPSADFGYQTSYGPNYVALGVGPALHVRKTGPGTGTVTSSPAGINCGATCDAPFFGVQTVTLTAHPGAGWGFGGWSGACTGSSKTCHVNMSQARTVTAKFTHASTTKLTSSRNPTKVGKKVTYKATVSPNPKGGTVRFTSGGHTISGCGAVAVNKSTGKATCSVTYHSKGKRKIRAIYSGHGNFAGSKSRTLTERIKKR
jgi:Bacterial Ig-like domain (group 3)/Divergent InlB B-repeat domain